MPRQPRHRPDAEPRGTEWALWLDHAMKNPPTTVKALVDAAGKRGATFDKTNVSRWLRGEKNADPTHAVIVARTLGRDPADALRAAGYDTMADEFARTPAAVEPQPALGLAAAALHLLREKGADLPEEELSAAEQKILDQIGMIEDYIHAMTELKRRDREPDDTEADRGRGAS